MPPLALLTDAQFTHLIYNPFEIMIQSIFNLKNLLMIKKHNLQNKPEIIIFLESEFLQFGNSARLKASLNQNSWE